MFHYKYPLSIQTVLPENYRENTDIAVKLSKLKEVGFKGVELNIAYPEKVCFSDLSDFLMSFELKMTMFASGLTAKTFNLSLSAQEEDTRSKAIAKILEVIKYLSGIDTGIILGFFKGQAVSDVHYARENFKKSIREIAPVAEKEKIKILVEATNRYESSVANGLTDTVELLEEFEENKYIEILPDTFHMNIEESDMFASMKKYKNKFSSIHLSDNNRFFPGFGAIDFSKIISFLDSINYSGGLAIEGNICDSFINDTIKSVKALKASGL